MKTAFTLVSVLLAASPALAGLIPSNGVLPGTPPSRRDAAQGRDVSDRAACDEDNVLRALMNPTRSAGASTFCSAYLQPTTTVTSTATNTQTSVVLSTTVITTSTTTVATATFVATILCPATPAATAVTTCNYPAYGFSSYLISQNPNTDPVTCHEMCLQDPNCQSFQVQSGGLSYCNLYNEPTSGYVEYAPDDVYTFFDRDCTQYLPAACDTAPSVKRNVEARDATTPVNLSTILATVPATRISSACSCLIKSPSATATVTIPATATAVTTTTATVPTTRTGTKVDFVTVTVTATAQASP